MVKGYRMEVWVMRSGRNTKPATMATKGQWLQASTMPVEAGHRYVCMTTWNGNTIGCWDQIDRSVLLRFLDCKLQVLGAAKRSPALD